MPQTEPDQPKAKYSVKEMMDVIRTDADKGTRRRRSHQPVVLEKRRKRKFVIIGIVILMVLGFAGVILQMLNRARVEGEIFRASANRRFSSALGCVVDFDRFRVQTWHDIDCPNVRLTGTSGVFKDALAMTMESKMTRSSYFRNEWDITDLNIDAVNLTFQPHQSPKRDDDEPNISLKEAEPDDNFRLGISAEPSFVTVQNLKINRVNITWPVGKDKTARLEDMHASGQFFGGALTLEAGDGRWIGGIWPDVPVRNLSVKLSDKKLAIQNARIQLTEKAEVRASGAVEFTKDGPNGAIDVKFDPMQVTELLHPAWQKRIFGKFVPGSATYTIKPGTPEEFSGEFTMEGVVLQGLPGLAALSTYFKTELYSKMEFRQFSAKFRRTEEAFILENINATRHGECKLTGSVTIHHDGKLEGKLRLAINTIESKLPQFAAEEDGLDVLEVTLGGTEDAPTDNLAELFNVKPTEPPTENQGSPENK